MADTAHAISRTSSLVQALHSQHVDKESFVLGMKKSTAPSYRESVSITSNKKFNSDGDMVSGGEVTMTLPKTGIVDRAFLRIDLTGAGCHTHNNYFGWAKNLACAMVESMTLQTHSRQLAHIDSIRLAELIDKSPHRDAFHQYVGYAWGTSRAYGGHQEHASHHK